ncbi:hypothetical protein LINGRAHAP2_LOCUS15286 [Linum grandiflorum]
MLGYTQVFVEANSLLSVQLIQLEDVSGHPLEALIRDIQFLLQRDRRYKVKHIPREGNFAADLVVKLGHSMRHGDECWLPTPT